MRKAAFLLVFFITASFANVKTEMQALYGENRQIKTTYDEALAAKCVNGIFVGKLQGGVVSFKGIPFAVAPVGELRWKAPQSVAPDSAVYEAFYFGKSPIQTEWPSEVASYYPQGEDCLKLNVWTAAATPATPRSVMVFFHGGSYGWGGTSDPIYDGRNFVERHPDIVLVTAEYRTGIMGFIDFSGVEGGAEFVESGNLGLLDCIEALRWVRENIVAFGGDPGNVTIFGESAGGGIVSLLPLIKASRGLFHKVIAQSGSIALTYSKEECSKLAGKLLSETGAKTMADLMRLSEAELMEANEALNDYNCFPERDGVVLPEDLYAAYAGDLPEFDLLIGTNADECRYWIREMGYYTSLVSGETIYNFGMPALYRENAKRFAPEERVAADAFLDSLNLESPWAETEFYNEVLFRLPALYQAEQLVKKGRRAYVYYWNQPSSIEPLGACHAVELAYVFNNPQVTIYTGEGIDTALVHTASDVWASFAKTGVPSITGATWPEYGSAKTTMLLGPNIHAEQDFKAHSRETLSPLLRHGMNGNYADLFDSLIYKAIGIAAAAVIVIGVIIGLLVF